MKVTTCEGNHHLRTGATDAICINLNEALKIVFVLVRFLHPSEGVAVGAFGYFCELIGVFIRQKISK